jgi:arsenite methyltransferase
MGGAVPLVQGIQRPVGVVSAASNYSLSEERTLVYVAKGTSSNSLISVNRDGTPGGTLANIPPGPYEEPRLSPDAGLQHNDGPRRESAQGTRDRRSHSSGRGLGGRSSQVAQRRLTMALAVRRGDYGYDAPYALVGFACLALASAIVAAIVWRAGSGRPATMAAVYCLFFSANAASFFYTTRHGKFVEWDRILEGLRLRGDERVLDMGCGRGAVLTSVARRLTTGRVAGVDIWSTHDQSGNARDVTMRNATLEGVDDRVNVETADMRALPFDDGTFDVVVSSLAIHNIRGTVDRQKAVAEGFRVLKPGGRMVIADIRATSAYADVLRTLGARSVTRSRLGWRFWWGNPIAATTLLVATKPAA